MSDHVRHVSSVYMCVSLCQITSKSLCGCTFLASTALKALLSITTLSIRTIRIMCLFVRLSINATQHNPTQHNATQHNASQHNASQHNATQHNATLVLHLWLRIGEHLIRLRPVEKLPTLLELHPKEKLLPLLANIRLG
jgi:hypothetical protein